MTTLIILLAAFIAYLVSERIELDRTRKSIPLVISVSGTRGKSTVERLLASVLRESGRKVLAKSTGSQAQYVLPDGSVEDIRRRGIVTSLEQKKLLRTAVALGADCVVAEVMSIRPENHVVESQHILKPDIVVITNVRKDHVDAMGDTVEEIGKVFQLDLHARCAAYTSVESQHYLNQEEINARSIEFNLVQPGSGAPDTRRSAVMSAGEFPENVDLGTYERNFRAGGRVYHHLIDPRTGYPATGTAGTTVVATDAELANAGAAALLIGGEARFKELTARMSLATALLVTDDGRLLMTKGMQQRLLRP